MQSFLILFLVFVTMNSRRIYEQTITKVKNTAMSKLKFRFMFVVCSTTLVGIKKPNLLSGAHLIQAQNSIYSS